MTNLILNVDSYKSSHYLQYPPNTQYINSYIETRGVDKDSPIGKPDNLEIVHFGLQAFIKEYLLKPITSADITDAKSILTSHGLPFNEAGWARILLTHDGYLPLKIEALPEGTPIPVGVPQVQVVNTDPELPWLTSYIETALLRSIWFPSSVATISRETKKVIYSYLKKTSDDPDGQIGFKLHDFGARGVSSNESAAIGGLAHIVNFMGTDTVASLVAANRYYKPSTGSTDVYMPAFSIPAAEHSTITSWGREHEYFAYENMVKQFGGKGKLFAVVSDSYDIYKASDEIWGKELKEKVLSNGGTVVIRPDSGNPVVVVLNLLRILGERFGFTTNSKGFKVLHPSVRLIQGDGVNYHSISEILKEMEIQGWSVDNLAFGMGGALLQKVNRDTFKYAMKANSISYDGKEWYDVFKYPVTDPGKMSKRGILAVIKNNYVNAWETVRKCNLLNHKNMLEIVYENGQLIKEWDFEQVRVNARL